MGDLANGHHQFRHLGFIVVKVQVTAIFRFRENVAGFGKNSRR